jgi:uncharacterized protein YuzE
MREVERTVRVSHDADADAGYIQLRPDDGEAHPMQVVVEDQRLNAMIVLDITAAGVLAGIEVIGVSPLLDGLLPD